MQSIFPRPQSSGGFSDMVSSIRGLVGGNPEAFAMRMMQTNPQFAEFVRANQGKSVEQIATENGIDPEMLRKVMG